MFSCLSDSTHDVPKHQSAGWPHPLGRLPSWISRWFGHRTAPTSKRPDYEICLWTFIGTFCGVSVLQAVFGHARYFIAKGAPPIVPSYAASAALIYGAIEGPLAQPRAFVGGYLIGALTGVSITKLFLLIPSEKKFQDLLWLSGSLISAFSVLLMQITGLMHPPAGAAAILALVNTDTREMGWYYIPVILLSSILSLAVALVVNNIRRCYPLYWFFPDPAAVADSSTDLLATPSSASTVYSVQGTNPSTRVNSMEILPEKLEESMPKHTDCPV